MKDYFKVNNIPKWKYKRLVLPTTRERESITFETSKSFGYLIQKIFVSYPVTFANPQTFQDPTFKFYQVTTADGQQDVEIPFNVMTTPNRYVVGGAQPPRNQQQLNALEFEHALMPSSAFRFEVFDFKGTGAPPYIDICVMGRNVFMDGMRLF